MMQTHVVDFLAGKQGSIAACEAMERLIQAGSTLHEEVESIETLPKT